MSEATSSPPEIIVDAQDPLPESNWVPRRWFAFTSLIALVIIKGLESYWDRQSWLTDALIFTVIVVYMIAPSAEQLTKLVQTASLFKAGVTFKSEKQVSSSSQAATGITRTEMGQPSSAEAAATAAALAIDQPLVESTDERVGEADNLPGVGLAVPSRDAPFYTGSPDADPSPTAQARDAFAERWLPEDAGVGKQSQ